MQCDHKPGIWPYLKVAESFFEPSNCEHCAISRKAPHLCKIRNWSWLEVVMARLIAATARVATASSLLDEAVRL